MIAVHRRYVDGSQLLVQRAQKLLAQKHDAFLARPIQSQHQHSQDSIYKGDLTRPQFPPH